MDNILNAPFIKEIGEMTANMYRLGWNERNGGNISMIIDEDELKLYIDLNNVVITETIDQCFSDTIGNIGCQFHSTGFVISMNTCF